jgi:segregation and condensation protein A
VFIVNRVKGKTKVAFTDLFDGLENRIHAIVTFLALLDLFNTQTIEVLQGDGMNNFWVTDLQAA